MADIRFRELITRVYDCENTRRNNIRNVPCSKHASTDCMATKRYVVGRGVHHLQHLIDSHPIYSVFEDDLADRKLLLAECQREV